MVREEPVKSRRPWVGVTIRLGQEAEEWFGELDCSLEDFFAAPDHAFVRLNHVRWLEAQGEYEEPLLVRNEDNDPPFHHYIYFRKSEVILLRPLRHPIQLSDEVF
jgi:hypothetical protein